VIVSGAAGDPPPIVALAVSIFFHKTFTIRGRERKVVEQILWHTILQYVLVVAVLGQSRDSWPAVMSGVADAQESSRSGIVDVFDRP
jgi:hypothetical protein